MEKEKLLKELEEKFEETKKELDFKATIDDIDRIFFIRDAVCRDGYVGDSFSRQMCSKIADTYLEWVNYLHTFINPNPGYLIQINESEAFLDKERNDIARLISKIMALISRNTIIGVSKDKRAEAEFIDEAVKFWDEVFKPDTLKILEKVNNKWAKDASKQMKV